MKKKEKDYLDYPNFADMIYSTQHPMPMHPMHPVHPAPAPAAGTILRIHIPAGAVINLLNVAEVSSPHGISLIVRLPFLGGTGNFSSFVSAIQEAGGTVEQLGASGSLSYPCGYPR